MTSMMTAEQLKTSILQMAMQGKLVEQRPEEGTGEELLQQILKKREKQLGNIKASEKTHLTSIKMDNFPFNIPTSWKWVYLGNLIYVISGVSYKKNDVTSCGIRILRGGNIVNMQVSVKNDDVFLPENYYDESKQVRIGDIVIVASTGSKTVIGKPGFISSEFSRTMIGAFLRICRPVDYCLSDYLRIIFGSGYYRKNIRTKVQGTNINNIKEEYITNLLIPLPPLAEQTRIVAKVKELMPFVDQYGEASSKLETLNNSFPEMLKKSILQQAIQGKLVPQDPNDEPASVLLKKIAKEKEKLIAEGKLKKQKKLPPITQDEIPFEIPESWKWARIGFVCSVKGGKRVPKGEKTVDIPTKHIYIRVTDMKNNTIVPDSLKYITDDVFDKISMYTISADDLYVTIAGTIGCVGNVPIMFDGMNLTENAAKLTKITIDKDFLLWVISSPLVQNQFVDRTHQVAQPKLAIIRIESTVIPIPPLAEQKRIVSKLNEIFCALSNLEKVLSER